MTNVEAAAIFAALDRLDSAMAGLEQSVTRLERRTGTPQPATRKRTLAVAR